MTETAAKELPDAVIYEEGLDYWPYRESLTMVQAFLVELDHPGELLDIMCGPGYLLGRISQVCRELRLTGVDIDERYIEYARSTYPQAAFEVGDVLTWRPARKFDTVLCTGALHHVPYDEQERAIANMAQMVRPDGFVIISDCYVDDYQDETGRQAAAAKLGYEYLQETIKNGAPPKVLDWTVDILHNDVLMHEYKTSIAKRTPLLQKHFGRTRTIKVWPDPKTTGHDSYGDYIHICSRI